MCTNTDSVSRPRSYSSTSVADQRCLSWIPDPNYPFPHLGSKVKKAPDPGSTIQNLSSFTPKNCSRKNIRNVYPGSVFFSSQTRGSRKQFPDPDPNPQCCLHTKSFPLIRLYHTKMFLLLRSTVGFRRDLVRLDGDGFEGTERLLDRTSLHQESVVHGLCLQLGAQH